MLVSLILQIYLRFRYHQQGYEIGDTSQLQNHNTKSGWHRDQSGGPDFEFLAQWKTTALEEQEEPCLGKLSSRLKA